MCLCVFLMILKGLYLTKIFILQDTTQPSPHVEIEKPNISPSDKIPDDSQVTSQHETCEENQHEKTEEVPPQQSNSDTNIASPHENVLHQECEFSSEKPKAEPDLNTSSKIEMQNDKGLCDNDREGDKEVASDELQRTRRQVRFMFAAEVENKISGEIFSRKTQQI